MTELTNKEKYKNIDKMLKEVEYMRRKAFNTAVLSVEGTRYDNVLIYGYVVENHTTIKALKQRYGVVMASKDNGLPEGIYAKIETLYNKTKTAIEGLEETSTDHKTIKDLIQKAEEIRNHKVREYGIVTVSDTSEIIKLLSEYDKTTALTPHQKETLTTLKKIVTNKYAELGLTDLKENK